MKRSELLNNPVFKNALPTSCLFVVNIFEENCPIKGIGEFRRDVSSKLHIVFSTGAPLITKEELEESLRAVKCKGVKKWDPSISFLFSNSILDIGLCALVRTMDHNLVLRPYWTDKAGSKIYFDHYNM